MPLFLRSLPLSLGTLWHYVFVLPIVIVMSIPFIFLSLIPIIGVVISTGLTSFITVISYRCALAAFGKGNEPDIVKLVKSSLALGFLNIFASLMILIAAAGVAIALSWLGIGESTKLPGSEVFPLVPGAAFMIFVVLMFTYHASIAVPTTALAHAATTHSGDPGLFFGFGVGFFSIMAAWLIWMAGMFLLGFYGVLTDAATSGVQLAFGGLVDMPKTVIQPINPVALGVAIAFLLWGPCWYSATAVLAWDRAVQLREAARLQTVEVSRIASDDLRALREARMPKTGS